ncbi:MAG: MFS transporter [Conexivisphaerales archaeon]
MTIPNNITPDAIEEGKRKIIDFVYRTTNTSARYVLFLAIAGMLMDAWNFAAFSAGAFAFKAEFHPTAFEFGIAAGIVNGGAAIGAITGGYLTDKFGRRIMFLINMAIFVVFAFLSSISANVLEFSIFRLLLGFGLGADVTTGFSYIFEFSAREQRKNYYSVWAYLWSSTYIVSNILTLGLLYLIGPSLIIWRILVGVSAPVALVILILRTRIPESVLWLVHKGDLKTAKKIIKETYKKDLSDIPDVEVKAKKITIRGLFDVFRIGKNKVFGYAETLNVLLTFSFWGFSFYIPIMLAILKFGTLILSTYYAILIYIPGLIAAIIAPSIIKKYGDRDINIISAFIVTLSLILIYLALIHIIPLISFVYFSALFIFFLFLGPFSYNSIINFGFPTKYRGIINGWNYTISKVIAFASVFFGSVLITTIGLTGNTLFLIIIDIICSVILIFLAFNVTQVNPAELESIS